MLASNGCEADDEQLEIEVSDLKIDKVIHMIEDGKKQDGKTLRLLQRIAHEGILGS